MHIKEIYEHQELETTVSDVTEKKFSPTCIVMPVQLELKRLELKLNEMK